MVPGLLEIICCRLHVDNTMAIDHHVNDVQYNHCTNHTICYSYFCQ